MQNMINTDQEVTITLKELTDLIGARHNDAMKKVKKLEAQDGFGVLRETRITTTEKGGRPFDTYLLTKKQAIAVGALLNNKLLMIVINRLEELENAKHTQPMLTNEQFMAKALILANEEMKQIPILEKEVEVITHKYDQAQEDKQFLSNEILKRDKATTDLSNRGNGMLIRDWAKALTNIDFGIIIKQSDLRSYLREKRYLMMNGLPYSQYVKNGYFKIRESSYVNGRGEDVPTYTTIVTKKGMEKLHDKVIDRFTKDDGMEVIPF